MNRKTYRIEITETLQRIVELDAASLDDALLEIRRQYHNEDIVLQSDDCIDTQIKALCPEC